MDSPVITLVVLALGVALVALLLAALTGDRRPDSSSFRSALAVVVVVSLGMSLVGQVRGNATVLNDQRRSFAATNDEAARTKCFVDLNRDELVEGMRFARTHIPEDGRFIVRPAGATQPCIYLSLLPRRHVPAAGFDPGLHWTLIQDNVGPEVLKAARRERRLPPDQRRHFVLSDSVAVVAPEDPAAR